MAKKKGALRFQQKLVLSQWLLSLFEVDSLEQLAEPLKDERLEEYDGENVSLFHHEITNRLFDHPQITKEELLVFDENIFRHTQVLNHRRVDKIRWKYFQYLALLFTEIYLDRYFRDAEGLREELNEYVTSFNSENESADHIEPFVEKDLRRIAFFQATGSGKTLLMHINIMQYRHYLAKHKREHELNRIILLTPNEGLSNQHLSEFRVSGMQAALFEKEGKRDLFTGQHIEIIDIHKLADKMGDKTVDVEAFEGNNLVLVDEGHRGSSGEEWMKRRNKLSKDGFVFEYSATFEQAIAASNDKKLEQQYSKSILFNYSYRYFYHDGFGKDYSILNLDDSSDKDEAKRRRYLTACMLTFYQQMRFFAENKSSVTKFNLEKPLLVLVGGKVNAVRKEKGKSVSDVIEYLIFLGNFIKNEKDSIKEISKILSGNAGLLVGDKDIFSGAFAYLHNLSEEPTEIFADLKQRLFNADHGFLMIEHLKGSDGEIALRLGDAEPFGVINVGDSKKLADLCKEHDGVFEVRDRTFADSYFRHINKESSPINVLIGSKKFTEGWSSWRVSTMGLMNIGKKEGSEIIQLFGRGVRLKGIDFSLKRSSEIRGSRPPKYMKKLETLNIFGVRAGYMEQFSKFLEEEGLPSGGNFEDIVLPVLCNYNKKKKLKVIRLKDDVNYKKDAPRPILKATEENKKYFTRYKITVNWYPKIQAKISAGAESLSVTASFEEHHFSTRHLSFMNISQIFFDLEMHKNQHGWHNLNLPKEYIRELLLDQSWYAIQIPGERMEFSSNIADDILRWEEIASALLKSYIEKFYKLQRSRWEHKHLEYQVLDENDRNLLWNEDNGQHQYIISVEAEREHIIKQITELKTAISNGDLRPLELEHFNAFCAPNHLYEPLIHLGKGVDYIKVKPVALNDGEKYFVEDLTSYVQKHKDFLEDKELYLLRNQSKGAGLGFFDEGGFYPDFILWIMWRGKQYISFIDPHGIRHARWDDEKLNFHKKIKEMESGLAKYDDSITLNSFIVSTTSYNTSWWGLDHDIEDFNARNVFFQTENKDWYVQEIIERGIA